MAAKIRMCSLVALVCAVCKLSSSIVDKVKKKTTKLMMISASVTTGHRRADMFSCRRGRIMDFPLPGILGNYRGSVYDTGPKASRFMGYGSNPGQTFIALAMKSINLATQEVYLPVKMALGIITWTPL